MCDLCSSIEWPALSGKRVVIGTSGSISIYRIPDLIRELKRKGADVYAGLSKSSRALLGLDVFRWATEHEPVERITGDIEHISLFSGEAGSSALLLAPASYNIIGKIASGIADTVPSLFFSYAFGKGLPVILAPAMHRAMLENPIMQENLEKLENLGIDIVDPEMDPEKAKLSDQESVIDHVFRAFWGHILEGLRVLVVSGRTEEQIDPVRVVTNRSTGLTGYWLARNAYRLGAAEVVFAGNSHREMPEYIESHIETGTDGLYRTVETLLDRRNFDLILVPAAISDFSLRQLRDKADSGKTLKLSLEPRDKLLGRIRKKHGGKLAAFRLNHTSEGIREHFSMYDPDFIVFNRLGGKSDPFGETRTEYTVFSRKSEEMITAGSKEEAAFRLLVHIAGQEKESSS